MQKRLSKILIIFVAFSFIFLYSQAEAKNNLNKEENQLVRHYLDISKIPHAKAIAFNSAGTEIWATSLLNNKSGVSVFDVVTGKKIKDLNLENGGGVEIAFTSDGTKAYVSQMETAKVFEIDANTKEILRTFNTGGVWPKILALSADEKRLFVSNWLSNDVSEINLGDGKLIRKIKTVKTPRGLYPTKDGKFLYVAGFDQGEIQKIDLKTGRGKVIFKSGGAMRHIVADEEKNILYVSDMGKNTIWKVNLLNDQVSFFAKTDSHPNTIALSPDKKILFVSNRGKNFSATNYSVPGPEWGTILLFDTENGRLLDAIIGGNQPTALAISPDGTKLAFSNFLDAQIEVWQILSTEILKKNPSNFSKGYKKYIRKLLYPNSTPK